jgi:hypothetical protein
MEKNYLIGTDPHLVSLAVWGFVHGLVSLAIRDRMEKFVPEKEQMLPMMRQSLNWFINTIENTARNQ